MYIGIKTDLDRLFRNKNFGPFTTSPVSSTHNRSKHGAGIVLGIVVEARIG